MNLVFDPGSFLMGMGVMLFIDLLIGILLRLNAARKEAEKRLEFIKAIEQQMKCDCATQEAIREEMT